MPKGLPFVPVVTDTSEAQEDDAAESSLAALYASYETPDNLKEAWASILQELKQTMLSASYVTIEESGLLAVRDHTALIAVPLAHERMGRTTTTAKNSLRVERYPQDEDHQLGVCHTAISSLLASPSDKSQPSKETLVGFREKGLIMRGNLRLGLLKRKRGR